MAFYESGRSGASLSYIDLGSATDFSYPLHFHKSFELIYVEEGSIFVKINNTEYEPKKGDLLLIPPDCVHSYKTIERSVIRLAIFGTGFLPEIYDEIRMGVYRDPLIKGGKELYLRLEEAGGNRFLKRSALYAIAAFYEAGDLVTDTLAGRGTGEFAHAFSKYLEENCTKDIDEKTAAKAFSYNPRYLSSLINKNFGVSFKRLLNEYRVKIACKHLKGQNISITSVYLASGFDSQSTFNRNFKAIMGVSPKQYRRGYRLGKELHQESKNNGRQ